MIKILPKISPSPCYTLKNAKTSDICKCLKYFKISGHPFTKFENLVQYFLTILNLDFYKKKERIQETKNNLGQKYSLWKLEEIHFPLWNSIICILWLVTSKFWGDLAEILPMGGPKNYGGT